MRLTPIPVYFSSEYRKLKAEIKVFLDEMAKKYPKRFNSSLDILSRIDLKMRDETLGGWSGGEVINAIAQSVAVDVARNTNEDSEMIFKRLVDAAYSSEK